MTCQGKQQSDGLKMSNWGKGFFEINTFDMWVTSSYKVCLVPGDEPFLIIFKGTWLPIFNITLTSMGHGTSSHTSFLSNSPSSSCTATTQYLSMMASLMFLGSILEIKHELLLRILLAYSFYCKLVRKYVLQHVVLCVEKI